METYFKWKIIVEYVLPLSLGGLVALGWGVAILVKKYKNKKERLDKE